MPEKDKDTRFYNHHTTNLHQKDLKMSVQYLQSAQKTTSPEYLSLYYCFKSC